MKKKIVYLTDRFSPDARAWLETQTQVPLQLEIANHPQSLADSILIHAHALIIRSRTKITEELLKKARQLQLIISCTSGFDHIDLEACQKWGITVMNTPDAHIESVTQLTWGLILACCQKTKSAQKMITEGRWQRDQITGLELSSRQLGVIGLGRIGRRVTRIAQAFQMNVCAYDPYVTETVFTDYQVTRMSLEKIFETSDVISLHAPKTLETDNLIKMNLLERAKNHLILINTARGSLIAEDDLIEALKRQIIGAIGLDVYSSEPLAPTSELIQFPQTFLTPHIGANTEEAFSKASLDAAEKLIAFFGTGQTSDTLPPRVPWYGVPAPQ